MTTFPLPTLSATVNEFGISAPTYGDILASLQAQVRAVFGSDLVLDPSSQDGQLLAIVALAINDANAAMIAVYNEFSPATAVGSGLASVVKINGIKKLVASNSTVDLIAVGQAGTVLTGAKATDGVFVWDLADTAIDASGQVLVTAICETPGTVTAEAGTVDEIADRGSGFNSTGWQTVTNPYAAVPGAPVETDAELRIRQSISVALPSLTVIDGINGAIAALTDVIRLKTYENDKDVVDADGIPPHTIAVVVEGGDAFAICTAIALKKTPGCGTYGSVGETILDQQGVPNFIKFFPLAIVEVFVEVTLTALLGYTSTLGGEIITQVAAFISTLPIGYSVFLSKVISATELGEPQGLTYDVTRVRMRRQGSFIWNVAGHGWNLGRWDGPLRAGDVTIAFNEAAETLVTNVSLIVNPS